MIHEKTRKEFIWHEKHNAWVICRDIDSVHTTGGSWFESKHFKTEEELKAHLDKEYLDNKEVYDRFKD